MRVVVISMGLLGLVACAPYPYSASQVVDMSLTDSGTNPFGFTPIRPESVERAR